MKRCEEIAARGPRRFEMNFGYSNFHRNELRFLEINTNRHYQPTRNVLRLLSSQKSLRLYQHPTRCQGNLRFTQHLPHPDPCPFLTTPPSPLPALANPTSCAEQLFSPPGNAIAPIARRPSRMPTRPTNAQSPLVYMSSSSSETSSMGSSRKSSFSAGHHRPS